MKSIEELQEKIESPYTREYFKEVYSSYVVGNYRSAVVMLYSVVICDIVYKLTQLRDLYEDTASREILEDIQNMQEQNPKSPEWERQLFEKSFERHRVLEMSDRINIENLQSHRNLCAHPVLKEGLQLFQPNQETTRAHIVNMLESVLTKPAFVTKDIFERMLDDIATNKEVFGTDEKVVKYIRSKYLDRLDNENVEYKFFCNLWKFVFKLENEDVNRDRSVLYALLKNIFAKHRELFLIKMERDNQSFSQKINIGCADGVMCLIKFLNENKNVFSLLTEDCKQILTSTIVSNEEFRSIAYFLSNNLEEHLTQLNNPSTSTWRYLATRSKEEYGLNFALDFLILGFSKSPNFNAADARFDTLIKPHLHEFSKDHLLNILNVMDTKGQVYGRKKAAIDGLIIKEKILSVIPDFDFSPYKTFLYNL